MKLTGKLITLFVLLSLIPLSIAGYLTYHSGRQTITEDTFSHLESVTILKQAELSRWIGDNQRRLERVAERPHVGSYAATISAYSPADPEYQDAHNRLIESHLQPALEKDGGFLEFFLLRLSDGQILASTDERREGKFREDELYFQEGQRGTYVQNVYYSLSREEAIMTIATPVFDGEDSPVAVLAGHVDPAEMSAIMAQGRDLRSTEETYLVNKFNFIVSESRFAPGYTLKKAVHTAGVEDCLQGNAGTGLYTDYRGTPVIGAYHWMAEWELCILTEMDQAEPFVSIDTLRDTVLGIGAGVAVIVTLLATFFARTITEPVRRLVHGAEEFSRGNLAYQVEVNSQDEVGQLASAFNAMASERKRVEKELREYRDHLEELVEERTTELTWANEQLQREISERKLAEQRIKAALAEKEVLLREIHHRVKNNLQALIYLIDMQAELIEDPASLGALTDLQGRTMAMAMIHEKLYQAEDLAQIDFSAYLKDLTTYLFSAMRSDRPLSLHLDADDIHISVNQAIPCGLIVNELVTNALQHAFPRNGDRAIQVSLNLSEGQYTLRVSDNGVGLPAGLDWRTTESLGLKLVNIWATYQLAGGIELENDGGTTFTIRFPKA